MKKFLVAVMMVLVTTMQIIPVSADEVCNHSWSSWYEDVSSTCGDKGQESRYCYTCYATEERDVPATGDHWWDDWYTTKYATIKRTGVKERECLNCYQKQTKVLSKLKTYAKFSCKTKSVRAKSSCKLKVKYAKGDAIKRFSSSNKKVATISKSGKVTGKKKGTTKITVYMKSGKKATCKIKVLKKKSTTHKKSGTVYWTPSGSVYHSTKNCPTLSRSRTIRSGSKSNCPKKRACKVCY